MGGMAALYRKEMSDHIRSKRFLIVLGLILLTSCASIYGALTGLSDAVASDSSYIFLKLFTLSGSSIPSFTSFIALLGPFVGWELWDLTPPSTANAPRVRLTVWWRSLFTAMQL